MSAVTAPTDTASGSVVDAPADTPTSGANAASLPRAGEHELDIESHRRELTGYCYRMLGSGADADDAVQEAMVRAWRNLDRFEGRSSLRSWLYRITTNVCLDQLNGRGRRARPMDMGPATTTADAVLGELGEHAWVQPVADERVVPATADPGELTAARETIRLAFVAALQLLPPRQRVVLILREVLRWQATEVAELLDASVASVNSALQRARATMAAHEPDARQAEVASDQEELLARYVDAFERYDIPSLVTLLHADATFSMPPHPLWLEGPLEVSRWMLGPGIACDGSKLVATTANGCAAFAQYKLVSPDRREPWSIQVIEVSDGKISAIHNYLYPHLFAEFGLPPYLED